MLLSVNLPLASTVQVKFESCKSQRQNEQSLASENEKRARVSVASSKMHAMSSLEEKLQSVKFAEAKLTLRSVMLVAMMPLQAALLMSFQLQVCAPLQCDTLQRVSSA